METKKLQWKCSNCGTENTPNDQFIQEFRTSIKTDVEAEYKRREEEFTSQLERTVNDIREQTRQESLLNIKGKDKLIIDLKDQLAKLRDKLDNSSQQLVGEIQELELEAILANTFPSDKVEPVAKGIRGADCILRVRTNSGIEMGSILFESKRVQNFSEGWIDKLKADNLIAKCNAMVIVTATMPKDMPGKVGIKDGVWIVKFEKENINQTVLALRYGLIKVFEVIQNQKLSGSKADKLYEFVTSDQFKSLMEHIIKGFQNLEDSFQEERKKLTMLLKLREAQTRDMLNTVLELFGTMRGISQEIPEVESLAMPKVD